MCPKFSWHKVAHGGSDYSPLSIPVATLLSIATFPRSPTFGAPEPRFDNFLRILQSSSSPAY